MLTAYFDDSGSHGDTKAIVFFGVVSTVDQWLQFEPNWRAILSMPQFDLEYLHMKELRSGKGRFAKFQDNLPLQRDLFERLHRILRVRFCNTFGGSVLLDDYDKMNKEYEISETLGPPLVMAAELAIRKLMRWRDKRHPSEPIRIVADQGIKHWGIIDDMVHDSFGFRLQPAMVSETPPLQAADMAAWELHRALSNMVKANQTTIAATKVRGAFRNLLEQLRLKQTESWFIFDESEMRRVFPLHASLVPKRV